MCCCKDGGSRENRCPVSRMMGTDASPAVALARRVFPVPPRPVREVSENMTQRCVRRQLTGDEHSSGNSSADLLVECARASQVFHVLLHLLLCLIAAHHLIEVDSHVVHSQMVDLHNITQMPMFLCSEKSGQLGLNRFLDSSEQRHQHRNHTCYSNSSEDPHS